VLLALVNAGAWFTVKVNVCGVVATVFIALIVIAYVPPVPAPGVPLNVAVPFPLSRNVTPVGSAPVSLSEGVGTPDVVTLNVPAAPAVNVTLLALVIAGGLLTVMVNAVAAEA